MGSPLGGLILWVNQTQSMCRDYKENKYICGYPPKKRLDSVPIKKEKILNGGLLLKIVVGLFITFYFFKSINYVNL